MESIVPRASNEDNVDRTISGLDAMLGIDPEEEKRKERRMQEEEAERTRRREARDAAAKTSLDPPVKPVKPAPPAGTVRGALGSQELDSSSGDGIWRRWDVPWSFTTLVLGVVGVEVAYIAAGLVAPIVVLLAAENDGLIDLQEITSDEPLQSQSQVLRPSDSSGQQSEIVTAPSLSGAPESPASGDAAVGGQLEDDPLFMEILALLEGSEFYKVLGVESALQVLFGGITLLLLLQQHFPLAYPLFHFSLSGKRGSPQASVDMKEGTVGNAAVPQSTSQTSTREEADRDEWLKTALWGGLAALGITIFVTWLSAATGIREPGQGAASNSLIAQSVSAGTPGIVTLLVVTGVVAPIFEETVFRGFLLASLTKWMPTSLSILLSAGIFASLHQQSSGDTIQLFCLGLVNGLAYCKTRNLATPMLIHGIFNSSIVLLFLLWTSGGTST